VGRFELDPSEMANSATNPVNANYFQDRYNGMLFSYCRMN